MRLESAASGAMRGALHACGRCKGPDDVVGADVEKMMHIVFLSCCCKLEMVSEPFQWTRGCKHAAWPLGGGGSWNLGAFPKTLPLPTKPPDLADGDLGLALLADLLLFAGMAELIPALRGHGGNSSCPAWQVLAKSPPAQGWQGKEHVLHRLAGA